MIGYIAENIPAFIITFGIRKKTCVLKMWMACLFRTLTAKDLDTYLPPSADRSSAGRHLNVVPPIWQRFHNENLPARKEVFDRAGFEALIRSDDPTVRSWARQATASYNALPTRSYAAIGRNRGYNTCGKFNIPLPQSLSMPPENKVFVQFRLYEMAVSHRYASEAMPCDPASRLAISIKGCNSSGNEVDEWIQSSGSKAAMRINTLVDMLEGITLTETRSFCRRWGTTSNHICAIEASCLEWPHYVDDLMQEVVKVVSGRRMLSIVEAEYIMSYQHQIESLAQYNVQPQPMLCLALLLHQLGDEVPTVRQQCEDLRQQWPSGPIMQQFAEISSTFSYHGK
ncbi:hypothetical protein PENNAL_c0101G08685 [Penicillium nalgiovense]|uniref:Uncharacterized protein n=1 Tax=Penicillium nalgiovense TaxID=60175 RepID=A0A1V6X9H5_PENNA|nr:hypothetical protein PENNAL_c0101G08685 [Penicillium nalgiovense]